MSGGYDVAIYKETRGGNFKRVSEPQFVEFHFASDNFLRAARDPRFTITEDFKNQPLWAGCRRGSGPPKMVNCGKFWLTGTVFGSTVTLSNLRFEIDH